MSKPDRTRGDEVIKFAEGFLFHAEGDFYGRPVRLLDWQKDWIRELYKLDGDNRHYRRALLGVGKGNGKTELCGIVGLYELLASGRGSPLVVVAAASYDQAGLLFDACRSMVTQSELRDLVEPYESEIRLRNAPGKLIRVAAVGGTNDGLRPSVAIFDELHEFTEGTRERCHLVISNGLSKRRDGLELSITTAGVAGYGSLCERLYNTGQTGNDPRFLFRWWEASQGWKLDDPAELRQAIEEANPSAGVLLDVDRLVARFREIPEGEFRRYHLDQWTASLESWLPPGSWDSCARADVNVEDGDKVVLGFDGSFSRDSTALIGCRIDDGHVFVVKVWSKPPHDPDWRVPRTEVEEYLEAAFDKWNVVELAADPPGWWRELEDWSARWGEDRVIVYPTNVRERMASACGKFFVAVTNSALTHDGNPTLARHLANCVTKPTAWGTVVTKEHKDSDRKIDAAVAAVVAHDRATVRRQERRAPVLW